MVCLTSINYTMKADIYKPYIAQDSSGAAIRTFVYEKTIDCYVRTDIKKGSGENSTFVNINDYINYLNSMLKLRTSELIQTNRKVVKIRNNDGIIWKENEDVSSGGGFEGSTIFEARGSTPVLNFDGSVVEYEVILLRQENQAGL